MWILWSSNLINQHHYRSSSTGAKLGESPTPHIPRFPTANLAPRASSPFSRLSTLLQLHFHHTNPHSSQHTPEPLQPLLTSPDLFQLHPWPRAPTLTPSVALKPLQGHSCLLLLPQQTPLLLWHPELQPQGFSLIPWIRHTPSCYRNVPSVSNALPPDPIFCWLNSYSSTRVTFSRWESGSFATSSQGPRSFSLEHLSQFIITGS